MFPFAFEWVWDTAHVVFMGGLWCVLGIIGIGLTYCIIKSAMDTARDKKNSHGGQ